MDVFAMNGRFSVGLMRRLKTEWLDGGRALRISSGTGNDDFISVWSNRGDFIEAVNEAGEVIQSGGDGNSLWLTLSKSPITLRYRALPEPVLSKNEMRASRKVVTRYLASDTPSTLDLPDKFEDVIQWMRDKLKEVPAACRKSARFNFDTSYEHGESYPCIEITYKEPESDEEVIRRLQIEAERARIAEECERAKLIQLQEKYRARSSADRA